MSATTHAERLIILDNHVSGLLARLHDMINFKKILHAQQQQGVAVQAGLSDLLFHELPKFIQALAKKFPETPENIEKVQGYDEFHKRATEIHTGLQPFYHTYLDVLETKALLWETLLDCVRQFTVLKFDVNRFIMSKFLDLFVKYGQLIILSSRVEDRRGLLSLYAQAHHKTGNTEPNLPRIAEFIKLYDHPIKQLREECGELSDRLGAIMMTLQMPVLMWSDMNNFHMKSVFNILDDPKTWTQQSKDKEYSELIHLDCFHSWIMWSYFMCPQALQTEGSVPVLLTVLKEHMVIPIFRDETLDIHTEMYELFNNFRVKGPKKTFKLSAHSKLIKEALGAGQEVVTHYQKLRTYLVCEMDILLNFLSAYPGCIAPKINMILAMTTLAKNNVSWYMRHMDITPIRKPRHYHFTVDHAGVSDLIRLNYAFKDLLEQYRESIGTYYKEQLLLDVAEIDQELPYFKQTAGLSPVLDQLIDLIMTDTKTGTTCDDTRLNWYRVSTALFHVHSATKLPQAQNICAKFIKLINHSRHIDLLSTEVNACGSFMSLMWTPEKLIQLAKASPASCMLAVVRTLSDSVQNLHKNAGEEAHFVVQVSQHTGITLLRELARTLIKNINHIASEYKKLRSMSNCDAVIARINDPNRRPTGFESHFECHNMTAQLRTAKQNVAALCQAIESTPTLHVCLIEFFPRAYLREEIYAYLRKEMLHSVGVWDNGMMKRPSQVLSHFKDVMYASHTMEQYMNINMADMFRIFLFNGLCDNICGGPADPLAINVPKPDMSKDTGGPLIEVLARWYTEMFNRPSLLAGHNPYSQTLRAFVNQPGYSQDTQSYTDVEELRALCTLIGPYGVRLLDCRLLEVISDNVAKIKQVLQNNQTTLTALVGKSMYSQSWTSAVNSIAASERELCAQAGARAGAVLKFRKDLKAALEHVVSRGVPFIFAPIKATHDIIHDFERANPDQLAMDMLASDCGIDVGEADHALRHALTKFKASNTDVAHWSLLPEMFSLTFKSTMWQRARYSVALDGHNNNAHCMDECLGALIVNFARINNTQTNTKPDAKIQDDLERFVRCASYSILHMYRANSTDESVHHAMMSIEMFVNRTDRVELAFLEECFPYTLLRTNYIQLYERQTKADGTAYAATTDAPEEQKTGEVERASDTVVGATLLCM